MDLYEYQGKQLFARFGIPVSDGLVATTPEEARAAAEQLGDPVMVKAYGQRMPLNQVGTVSAPEPRLLTVNVWDKGLVTPTAKAIRDAGLGVFRIGRIDQQREDAR